jgi:hypothetical protein
MADPRLFCSKGCGWWVLGDAGAMRDLMDDHEAICEKEGTKHMLGCADDCAEDHHKLDPNYAKEWLPPPDPGYLGKPPRTNQGAA